MKYSGTGYNYGGYKNNMVFNMVHCIIVLSSRNTKFIGRNGATYSGFGLYISSSLVGLV